MYAKRQIVSSGSRASDAANKTYEAQEVQQTKKTNLMTEFQEFIFCLPTANLFYVLLRKTHQERLGLQSPGRIFQCDTIKRHNVPSFCDYQSLLMKYTLTGKDVVIFLIHVVNILHFTFCSSLKKSMDVWSRVCCLWLWCFVYQRWTAA